MRVTGIEIFEDLLTEAELATISNNTIDVVSADSSSWVEQMDTFLDSLVDYEADKLKRILSLNSMSPGMAVFLDEKTIKNVIAYVKFTKSRLDKKIKDFIEHSKRFGPEGRINSAKAAKDIISLSNRLQSLNQIYDKINELVKAEGKDPFENPVLQDLYNNLNVQKKETSGLIVNMAKTSAEHVATSLSGLNKKTEAEKEKVTNNAVATAIGIDNVADNTKDEETKRKSKFYSGTIFDNYVKNGGSGDFFKKQYRTLKDLDYHYLDIVERIEKLRKWDEPASFDSEVQKIIALITSTGKVFSETVITHLTKRLAEAIAEARERMSLKKTELKDIKGSLYRFEVRLPLYRSVNLPVTAKQIADASFMKRVSTFLERFGKLLPELVETKWDVAHRAFGETIQGILAPATLAAGSKLGKALNGRTGERTAQAATHSLFKDKYIKEDGMPGGMAPGAPGAGFQVPSSVSSMGPISAPTLTHDGSGDKFDEDDEEKKKKKRREDEGK